MKKRILLMFALLGFLSTGFSQTVSINNKKFVVNGNASCPIYFNGANTPWESWNDFGGSYNQTKWAQDMVDLKNKGINAARIWFSCNGAGQPSIATDGTVSAPTAAFWANCDHLFAQAQANGIYIQATMMSFDHTKTGNPNANNWRAMMNDPVKIQSYITNYLVPFVNRYKTNPYLWSIDLCNEIEWIHENTDNWQCSYATLQQFVGLCAAGLHQTSVARTDGTMVLVSLGSACVKWNGTKLPSGGTNPDGNKWSDANLKAQSSNNANAYLDFYSPHFYGWMESSYSSPFEKTPTQYGMDDKACVVAEMPSRDPLPTPSMSLTTAFNNLKNGGWQGHMPWTANITTGLTTEVGSLADFGAAAQTFANNNSTLVKPNCTVLCTTVAPTVTTPVVYCVNASAVALTATGTTLKWYADNTTTTALTGAPTPSTGTAGTINYYVSQTLNGCEGPRALIAVKVNALPTATITAGGATTFCTGGSVALTTSGGTSYQWNNAAGTIAGATSATYSATTSGSYTVKVTNANNCSATSTSTTVTVSSGVTWYQDLDGDGKGDAAVTQTTCTQPTGYVSAAGDACPTDANKLAPGACGCGNAETDTDGDLSADCVDTDDDNDGISDAADCAPLNSAIGSATVWYQDSDGDGKGDDAATQTSCDQPTGYVPVSGDACPTDANKLTPGICGCGIAEGTCPTTGVVDLKSTEAIKIMPNPSSDQFNLILAQSAVVHIYTVEGKLVEIFPDVTEVKFGSEYAKGVYVIQIMNGSTTQVVRVIKQ